MNGHPIPAALRQSRPLLLACALLALAPNLGAQSNYATPYTFTTLAGSAGNRGLANGTGIAAQFNAPEGIAVDSSGNVYVADGQNAAIRKITPAGVVTTLFDRTAVQAIIGPAAAQISFVPQGIAVDAAGNLYVVAQNVVFEYTSAGVLSMLAGSPLLYGGYADGPLAQAMFNNPIGIAVDSAGNLYVADYGNFAVRKIAPALGVVSTLAGDPPTQYGFADGKGTIARFHGPTGVAVDSGGTLYVTDSNGTYTVRKITSDGTVTTIAGNPGMMGSSDGTGTAAEFNLVSGIAIDSANNLYVTDSSNTIRKVTTAGVVTTLAGTPGTSGTVDGSGAAALFNYPFGVAVDAAGDVFVTEYDGDTVRVRYASALTAPVISSQPASASVAAGSPASFSVSASGLPAPSYQWMYNGSVLAGATGAALAFPSAQAFNIGTYSVVVTNFAGQATSSPVTLSIPGQSEPAASTSQLTNISSRAFVQSSADIEIAGFAIAGPPGSSVQVLVRGVGPTLSQFNVLGVLPQTVLTLFDQSQNQVATNSGWGTNSDAAQIAAAVAPSGAFALPQGSLDSALLLSLAPGSYTAHVAGTGSSTGIALAEIYEVASSGAQLSNISTRAYVGTGANVEIAGIVITGTEPVTVLVRAVGPALSQFNVAGVLAQPSLSVVSTSGLPLASNTGWSTNASPALIAADAQSVGAFAFQAGSADSAVLVTLQPGTYTAIVSGAAGTSGVALVEVYQVH